VSNTADDLAAHVTARLKTIMLDATDLVETHSERLQISVMVAAACVGYAAGFLCVAAKESGHDIDKKSAFDGIIHMIAEQAGKGS
jgi:hypothetical protein